MLGWARDIEMTWEWRSTGASSKNRQGVGMRRERTEEVQRTSEHGKTPQFGFRQLAFISLTVSIVSCTGYRPVSIYEESVGRSTGPDFFSQVFSYYTDGSPRTDLYIAVNNASLHFTRKSGRFTATYDVSARILADKDKHLVTERSWTETVTESDYDATLSRTYHISPRSFSLEPGSYTIALEITDEISKRTLRQTRALQVPDFRSLFLSLSDLMIGSHHVVREGQQRLLPNVDPEMSYVGEPQYVYYEVYAKFPGREMKLNYKLYGVARYEPRLFASPDYPTEPARQLPDTLFWSQESTFTTGAATTPVSVSLPGVPTGHYRLDVILRGAGTPALGGQLHIRMSRVFTLWPYGFPELSTLDQQTEVLEHIATPAEFRDLNSAKTKEEKKRGLIQFWARHSNRDEYYKRAVYANRYFSCLSEGWRTPLGWTYMVAGPPEDIQLSAGGEERWLYTLSSNRMLQFIFFTRDVTMDDTKCKTASMAIDPVVRIDLIARWRKSD
jgi:GWxTD domain-containing protein